MMACLFTVGAIVIEGENPTCPSWESNLGRWVYGHKDHVDIKGGFNRKAAVQSVYYDTVAFA